jgi:hypothetical protein
MRGGFYLDHYIRSSILPGIKGCLSDITINFLWLIGTGALVFFWKDNCLGYSLVDALHILPNEHRLLTTLVADSIIDVAMVIPLIITFLILLKTFSIMFFLQLIFLISWRGFTLSPPEHSWAHLIYRNNFV